ncbi:hypothetical protein D3C86_767890 [compost metagenome]
MVLLAPMYACEVVDALLNKRSVMVVPLIDILPVVLAVTSTVLYTPAFDLKAAAVIFEPEACNVLLIPI